jgi:4-hydroxy-tetrahydrodipicolinate reductase
MLRIGLLGYGKMGRAIDALAAQHGAEVVWRAGQEGLCPALRAPVDVVIEFSRPEVACLNVCACLEAGLPVVSGTTGWLEHLPKAESLCLQLEGAMIWASNFSVGVNLFFAINKYLAALMARRPEYTPGLTEVHHIHKLDAPSGTAITLAEQIVAVHPDWRGWSSKDALAGVLTVASVREGEVPGTHRVDWCSPQDTIRIEHEAQGRDGFAAGALLAAHWLQGRKGVYTMSDVLGLPSIKT